MATLLSTDDLIFKAGQLQPDNTEQFIQPSGTRTIDQDVAFSSYNKLSDKDLVNLRDYKESRVYEVGEGCLYDTGTGLRTWRANTQTQGTFNPLHWDDASGAGSGTLNLGAQQNGLVLTGSGTILELQLATAAISGALSSSDWQTFNAKQDAIGFTPENAANKGQASGYAPLDSGAKVPTANLPDAVVGSLNYVSTWNASTNVPNISDSGGTKGQYYVVSASGTQDLGSGAITFLLGDWVVHNGTIFEKLENVSSGVQSVQGLTNQNINLGTGAENNLVVWTANDTFQDLGLKALAGGKLGVGGAISSSLILTLGQVNTGFSKARNEADGFDRLTLSVFGAGILELRNYDVGSPQLVNTFATVLGEFNNDPSHLKLFPASANTAQILFDPSGDFTGTAGSTNGSLWANSTGLFYRHAGQNYNLLLGGGGGGTGIPTIGASTDKALVLWNGTGGNAVQNSSIVYDDGNLIFNSADGLVDANGRVFFGVSSSGNALINFNNPAASGGTFNITGDRFSLNFDDAGTNPSGNNLAIRDNTTSQDVFAYKVQSFGGARVEMTIDGTNKAEMRQHGFQIGGVGTYVPTSGQLFVVGTATNGNRVGIIAGYSGAGVNVPSNFIPSSSDASLVVNHNDPSFANIRLIPNSTTTNPVFVPDDCFFYDDTSLFFKRNGVAYDILQTGGGGSSTFTGLNDTPADYAGNGDKIVKVKNDETGLEFTEGTPVKYQSVLNAHSTAIQEPTGTGEANALLVTFPTTSSSNGEVTNTAGILEFSEAKQYQIDLNFQYGRSGSTGESQLVGYATIELPSNPNVEVPLSNPIFSTVDGATDNAPYFTSLTFEAPEAGTKLRFYLARDTDGNDSGGLYPHDPADVNLENSYSAQVEIKKIIGSVALQPTEAEVNFTTVTPEAGFGVAPTGFQTLSVAKIGNAISLTGILQRTGSGTTPTDLLLCILPVGFRPSLEHVFDGSMGASPAGQNGESVIRVKTNGHVTLTNVNFLNQNDVVRMSAGVRLS